VNSKFLPNELELAAKTNNKKQFCYHSWWNVDPKTLSQASALSLPLTAARRQKLAFIHGLSLSI
jgi:hypothetical protein